MTYLIEDVTALCKAYIGKDAPGAIPCGTRVRKVWSERGDMHAVGEKGTVMGSMFHAEVGYAYLVDWDDLPADQTRIIGFIIGSKIEPTEGMTSPR